MNSVREARIQNGENRGALILESQIFRALDLLSLYICVYAAGRMGVHALLGAALYMAGFTAENSVRLFAHRNAWGGPKYFSRLLLTAPLATAVAVAALCVYQARDNRLGSLFLLATALLLTARSAATHAVILRFADRLRGRVVRLAAVQAAALVLLWISARAAADGRFAARILLLALIYPATLFIWLYLSRRKPVVGRADYRVAGVSSCRIFYGLLLCSNVALYLSVISYTGMLAIMPSDSGLFLPVALWIALIFTGTVILGGLLSHRFRNAEKSSLFIAGGVLWVLAQTQLTQSIALLNFSMAWIWSLLQAAGLALMLLLAARMQEDMRLVLELTDDVNEASARTYRSLIQQISFVVAGALITAELYVLQLALEGRLPLDIARVVRFFHIPPLGFVLLSMFFALAQPLNRDFLRKLRLYRDQKLTQTVIPAFERRLRSILVKRYRKRVGIRILSALVKPWCYHRVVGTKNVQPGEGPVIFVANHREIYGPIVVNLYLPFSFRPWIESQMLERAKIADYLWENTFSRMKATWLARKIMHALLPLIVWALGSVEPIPVYRGVSAEAVKTMKMSVTALQEQDNLLIFPEDPSQSEGGRYAQSGVSPFYTGFVHVARLYYKQAGRVAVFVPVYADPRRRTIRIGQGVAYDPKGNDEAARICGRLMEEMNGMAGVPASRKDSR